MRLHVGSASLHDWLSLSPNLGRANFCSELTSSCWADSYAQARSSRGCTALQLSSNRRSLSRLEDALYPSNQRLLPTPEIYTAGQLVHALALSRSRSGLPLLPVQYSTDGVWIRYPNEATIQKPILAGRQAQASNKPPLAAVHSLHPQVHSSPGLHAPRPGQPWELPGCCRLSFAPALPFQFQSRAQR